jgi:hypothetical protein
MLALIDGDILRYEIGFAAETGWKAVTDGREDVPPWDYVQEMVDTRIANIKALCKADEHRIYLTRGKTFRYEIAKSKPYKGTRVPHYPWHFDNLTAYLEHAHPSSIVTGIEADDAMALDHIEREDTIICSRDKDLMQVPGWHYSWELGNQPSFGPILIEDPGELWWSGDQGKSRKLLGTGVKWFYAQMIMGDRDDNIPGIPGAGAVAAFEALDDLDDDMY